MRILSGTKTEGLGVKDGRLKPCPGTPNCVSSMEEGGGSRVDPIEYDGSRADAHAKLTAIIQSHRGALITETREDYIHAEYKSSVFGFVDDVEFYLPDETQRIEVRSAARAGYWDLGVNRARVEEVREAFEEDRNR